MPAIEIIAASAGSGKTYRLAKILGAALAAGEARPENVVAVTFTIKAAAELEERVRRSLVESGRADDAHRMAVARIGTVHAVASNLIRDFAFDLGVSPRLEVLDEAAARRALKAAFSQVATPERQDRLAELASRMPQWDWEETRREILDWARDNAIDAAGLARSRDLSRASFRDLLDPPLPDAAAFEAGLRAALRAFLAAPPGLDTTKKTARARDLARRIDASLERGAALAWDDWQRLATFDAAVKSKALAQAVAAAAADFPRHPRLRADLEEAIGLAFDLAADALDAYRRYKTERGVVDFADQLRLALELLRTESVREQLAGSIDLVLVDEFQDTSPIQLAVFLELARLAKRSVWVGDQKQAIYGFLGCDPALMDSAIEAILGGREPETLKRSWRSRPRLVELTSDLFAPAFDQVGIPPERTRLTPAHPQEPAGLGPAIERWRLDTKNAPDDAAAVAAGVRELLSSGEVRVRDAALPGGPIPGGVPPGGAASGSAAPGGTAADGTRPARPSDVAVLCRTNQQCLRTAEALGALGIPCVLARPGLLRTPEAELVVQGLARWADPRDTLAAAVIARLAVYPADGQEWLDAALEHPHGEAFAATEPVARLDEARRQRPAAGVLEAFDEVVAALAARPFAAARGAAEQRLANLEALRALAAAYAGEAATGAGSEGAGTTPAGFVAWLRERAAAGEDPQAVLTAGDAVVVYTWHGAKGLEWPITVLCELEERGWDSPLGVHIEARAEFDFEDPLAGRWIRFWPNPYEGGFRKPQLIARAAEHELTARLATTRRREALRLRYVGWTRARDRVVLVSRKKDRLDELLDMVSGPEGPLVVEPSKVVRDAPRTEEAEWAGHRVEVRVRELAPVAAPRPAPEDGERYAEAGPRDHPPAVVLPSAASATGEAGEPRKIGDRIAIEGSPDWQTVGEVFHGFLAADGGDATPIERLEIARQLAERWGLGAQIRPADVVAAADRLQAWIGATWTGATGTGASGTGATGTGARQHREWPLLHRLADGSLVRGTADLVLELDETFVLVDHKTFPGGTEQAREAAAGYAGQLRTYAAAIAAATGKRLEAAFIHLPVSGMVIEVS
ncbi:MAG: UvrD-helicase domain-containing protein [Acidobacteriota bacterium]|nr:UvrD-helicase domain-containing protein [Acidobacteriota bacterium]